jgi:hypothetical protein
LACVSYLGDDSHLPAEGVDADRGDVEAADADHPFRVVDQAEEREHEAAFAAPRPSHNAARGPGWDREGEAPQDGRKRCGVRCGDAGKHEVGGARRMGPPSRGGRSSLAHRGRFPLR